jgi:ribose transport system substrate-binding protein
MRWFRAFRGLAAALAIFIAAGCGQSGKRSGPAQVAFVSNNAEDFWTIAEAGTKKASEELGIAVAFKRPQVATAAEQKKIIEDLLTQGIDAIAVSVIDPDNQIDFLNQIAERANLITQDNDAPKSKRKCYIGTDNYEAGKAVGKLVKEVMPDGGTIAIFVGQPDPLNARQRRGGVLDELAGQKQDDAPDGKTYGKYELAGTYYDNASRQKAKDNASDVLTKLGNKPNVCLIGLWAYNPPAIRSAVLDAGKQGKVHVVGFDEDEQTLEGIKAGDVYATVVQQPFLFGYESVKLLWDLKQGRAKLPADGIKYVPHKVIKKDNVAEFQTTLHKMLGKE